MSCTEIYSFDKSGNAYLYDNVQNSFRSGMAIWRTLENEYLPPYMPGYAELMGTKLSRIFSADKSAVEEIWNLYERNDVSRTDKICLLTTFDSCLARKEDVPLIVAAFRAFEGDSSLPEQADILERMLADDNCIAVGWNQSSVSCDTWDVLGGYDDKNDCSIPYNCLTGDKHFWLFDELKEVSGNE